MPNPSWAGKLTSYWALRIPTAVNGVIPNWSSISQKILPAYQRGAPVTYVTDAGYQYHMERFNSSSFFLIGRVTPGTPSAGKCRVYTVTINRSTGAVTTGTIDFTTS